MVVDAEVDGSSKISVACEWMVPANNVFWGMDVVTVGVAV